MEGLSIPMIAGIAAVLLIVILFAVGYVKAPPDMAFIISGVKKKSKIVIGKASIQVPFLSGSIS